MAEGDIGDPGQVLKGITEQITDQTSQMENKREINNNDQLNQKNQNQNSQEMKDQEMTEQQENDLLKDSQDSFIHVGCQQLSQ